MIIENFHHEPGVHCGSVAMADMLRWAGVDLSEPMVFGLGAGLGFYYLQSDYMSPTRQIVGRSIHLEENVAEALGLELVEHRTSDGEEGWRGVRSAVESGRPALVQCDLSELPYWESSTPFNGHRIVVAGYDDADDSVYVADTHFEGLECIDREALHRARASDAPPSFGNRFAWWELEPASCGDIQGAIREAIARNVEEIESDESGFTGMPGLDLFREEVAGWRDLDDAEWCYRFAYQCIEKRGTGGAMFRNLYRKFLSEAADYVPEILQFQLPVSMSRNADAWSTLATYLKAMALYIGTEGEEPDEDPNHHVESMAEAVYQFESTFWDRARQMFC